MLLGAAVVALLLCLSPTPAQAAFVVKLTQGATVEELSDDDGDGVIEFAAALGDFDSVSLFAFSKPELPNTPQFAQTILTGSVMSSSAGALEIELTDTDFAVSGSGKPFRFFSSLGAITGGEIAGEATVSLDGTGDVYSLDHEPITPPMGELFASLIIPEIEQPFSMTQALTIEHDSADLTTTAFSAVSDVAVIPEPSSLALCLWGLPTLGGFCWRRRRGLR